MLEPYFYFLMSHALTLQFGEREGRASSPAPSTDALRSHAVPEPAVPEPAVPELVWESYLLQPPARI